MRKAREMWTLGARALAVLVMAAVAGLVAPVAVAQAAITPDAAISVTAANSGLCLGVSGGVADDNAQVIQYLCDTKSKLRVVPKGTDTYQLVMDYDSKCLRAHAGGTGDYTWITQAGCTNDLYTQWKFVAVPGKTTFRIVSAQSGKCLTIRNNSGVPRATAILFTCKNTVSQLNEQFFFPPATSDELATPLPAANNTPVAVAQGGSTAGVGPLVYSYVNNNGQLRRGYQANPEVFNETVWETSSQFDLFAGRPTVSKQADGRVLVTAQHANDGDLWTSRQNSAGASPFSDWQDVGGSTISQPVTATLPNGKLVTFALAGGKLWHLPQDGTNAPIGLWRYIGGTDLAGEPAVVVTPTGLRVYVMNSIGELLVAEYETGKLGDFTNLGGGDLVGTPGVMVRPGYVNRIVMRTSNGTVVTKLQKTDGTYEADWTPIPGVTAAGNPSAVLDPQTGRTGVVVRATDNTVWFAGETGQSTGQWNSWMQPSFTEILTDPTIFTYEKTGGQTWAYVTRDANRTFVTTTDSAGNPQGRTAAGATPKFTQNVLPKPPAK